MLPAKLMTANTTKRFGQFELLERIGSGGMAEVFKARIRNTGGDSKLLALKKMRAQLSQDPEWVAMFTAEARITAQLDHPNIVQVLHFGRLDGQLYLAMEYIEGHDLGRLIERANQGQSRLPLPIAVYIARELCRALYYAHRHRDAQGKLLGLVHRDVSPQNVLVSRYGDIKLLDFGIAKAIHHSGETTQGKLKGKYNYMAPEQMQNDPVDRRTDIFALGAVLYEMLTGHALFQRPTILATTQAVIDGPIPVPSNLRPEIPPQLDAIVLKALARPPRDRFDSARVLRNELEECARDSCGIAAAQDVAAWLQGEAATELAAASQPRDEQRLLTHPASLQPTMPPATAPDVALGTLPFGEDAEETGVTSRKLAITKPTFDGNEALSDKKTAEHEGEWTIDEGGKFFEPSGNKTLDADPNALLHRLSSTENQNVLEEYSADSPDDVPTTVALIDVETLIAERNAQLKKGHSAEMRAPALGNEDALYAFSDEDEPTASSPRRTVATLKNLKNLPSAEVVTSDLPLGGDVATRKDLPAPRRPGVSVHELAMAAEGEGFEEDAATVISVNPPSGMLDLPGADDEAPEFPEETAISLSGVGLASPSTDGKRQPASPTEGISFDMRMPLEPLAKPPASKRAWLWATVALLVLASAGAVAYVLLSGS